MMTFIKYPKSICEKCKHPIAYEDNYAENKKYWYCICGCYILNMTTWEEIKYLKYLEVYNNKKWDNRAEFNLTKEQIETLKIIWSIRVLEHQKI
jgi:hypothetical protein